MLNSQPNPQQNQDFDHSRVDESKQISLEQRMIMKDAARHKNFFDSLKPARKFANIAGLFVVGLVIVGAIVASISLKGNNVGTKSTSASSDCGDYQVKVITSSGYYCQDCEAGQYGKLNMCEDDSPTHKCNQVDSGCFKPEI